MLVPLTIALCSVALGALLGLGGSQRSLFALSTFAIVSALAVVLAQLLPDALSEVGLWALLVCAGAALLPTALQRASSRLGTLGNGRLGLELGYLALLVHKVADGVGLGTYGGGRHADHGHFDVLFAIAAHTVPIVALVTIAFHRRGGLRSVALRVTGLAAATLAGVYLPALVSAETFETFEPWLTAAVGGLLLHVVAHDWQPHKRTPSTVGRLVDLSAVAAGMALVFLGGHESHHDHGDRGAGMRTELGAALLDLAIETAPALLAGLVIGALLTAWGSRLPTKWLRSGGAFGQALRGAVVGAPLPICACGVLPLAASLRKKGAGAALVVAFLIATPELGVETLALTASFVGWPFALVRLGAAIVLAMVAALAIHRATGASGEAFDPSVLSPEASGESSGRRFLEAFDDLLYHVAPWTVVGLIAAAYVTVALPMDSLGELRTFGLDIAVLTLIAIPSYVCAASATPLAAVLLAKGLSPGAVLIGLLLGPATNLATLGFLRKTFGGRATLIGVGALVLSAWVLAFALNVVDLPLDVAIVGGEHDHGWGAALATGLLGLALLRSIWRSGLRAWLGSLGEAIGGGHDHRHPHDHHHHGHDHHHHHG